MVLVLSAISVTFKFGVGRGIILEGEDEYLLVFGTAVANFILFTLFLAVLFNCKKQSHRFLAGVGLLFTIFTIIIQGTRNLLIASILVLPILSIISFRDIWSGIQKTIFPIIILAILVLVSFAYLKNIEIFRYDRLIDRYSTLMSTTTSIGSSSFKQRVAEFERAKIALNNNLFW